MIIQALKVIVFMCILAEYLRLNGNWTVTALSKVYHSTFLDAKTYCSLYGNCHGIIGPYGVLSGFYSVTFPVEQAFGGDWYVYKKEHLIGMFID